MILTYVFIVFLDTYINMIKCLQRILLYVFINLHYLHQDAERLIQKYQRWDHTGSIKSNHLQAYEKARR